MTITLLATTLLSSTAALYFYFTRHIADVEHAKKIVRIAELEAENTALEADLAEQHGLNAVQSATITTLRDRNAILRDTLEAVPSPVATVLDIASRVGHKLGGFL